MTKVVSRDETTGAKSTVTPTFENASHAGTHTSGSGDEVDGDQVDIDVALTNITPDTTPAEVTLAAHLGAILKGVDNQIGLTFPGLTVAGIGAGTLTANVLGRASPAGSENYDLPALAGVNDGDFFGVFDGSGVATVYSLTITPNGAETINGVNAPITITDNRGVRGLVKATATNWAIIWNTVNNTGLTMSPVHTAAQTLAANEVLRIGTLGSPMANTLPALAGVAIGDMFAAYDEDGSATSQAITIVPNGAELINGVNAAITLADDYGFRGLVKTSSTNWAIVWTTAGAGGGGGGAQAADYGGLWDAGGGGGGAGAEAGDGGGGDGSSPAGG